MITAIIIIAYIANVFFNRWLSKIIYKSIKEVIPILWFFSLIGTGVLIYTLIDNLEDKSNWFTGKNW